MVKTYAVPRREPRMPLEVAVQIAGHPQVPGVEMTFTENVSSRGARVLTSRRWKTDDQLFLASLPGNFRSAARVAYCESVRGAGFAIGVEFVEPTGKWVLAPQDAAVLRPTAQGPQAA